MKRTLSLVLAVLMVLALFGAAAEDTKKVEIRVNMQAGTGVAEAWAAVEAGYEALHPEVDIIIDLKPDEGYAVWVKAQFSSENPEADLVAINLAGPAASCKSLNFGDSPVMSEFMRQMYGLTDTTLTNNRCIELPNGRVVTPKEAIEYLKSQKEEEADG